MATRLRTLAAGVVPVVVGLLAAGTAWWRLGPVTRGTGWAEDAGIFLRERLADGPVDSVLTPYAGYLHLLPRLTVDLGVALPVEDYARTVSAASCGVAGAVCAAVFVLAREVVPAWPLRLVLAAVPVVLPIAPYEVSGTAANQHWYMLALVPWLFAHRARSWWSAWTAAVVALVAGLTEPQTALFLPLLLLAWLPWRSGERWLRAWRALPVTVAAVVATAAQLVTALTTTRTAHPERPGTRDAAAGYLLQVLGGSWTASPSRTGLAVVAHGWAVLLLPAGVLLAVVVVAVARAGGRTRVLLLALGGGSGALWYLAMVASGGAATGYASGDPAVYALLTPTRYAVAPAVLLVSCVVLAAAVLVGPVARPATGGAGRTRRPRTPAGRRADVGDAPRASRPVGIASGLVGWCVVAVVVASAVGSAAPGPTRRSAGTPWRPQVLAAAETCRTDPDRVLRIAAVPWRASVPCALVRER